MAIYDDMFGLELNIGDTVCKTDDNTFWRIAGISKDMLGRDRLELEPVSQPNNCYALINADGVMEGFGKMELESAAG